MIDMSEQMECPKHVAIIMDGNGRWAKKKGMLRTFGHESGVKSVREAIEYCIEQNIPYLTLYAFSSENWNRPKVEVEMLMNLLMKYLKKELSNLLQNGVKLNAIGQLERLPKTVFNELQKTIDLLKENSTLTLTLALAYGARQELLEAFKKTFQKIEDKKITIQQVDENTINDALFTANIPDVDLLIRTSGEYRISNFLLWQIAYAELYFTDVLWPDFTKEHFHKAICDYQKRERRFGKTSEQLK